LSGFRPVAIFHPLEVAMSNTVPMGAPQARRSLLRFIVDRNPFFLLSALCMFVGVRVILSALNSAPGDVAALLRSIVALHVYEATVIGLGLYLIVRRGQHRDGWMLLSIEALFLVDLTNLNAELFTANLRWGIVINLLCWMLAVVKVTVVLRTLKLRLTTPEFGYVALQLAGIFFMAGIFKQIARGGLHEGSLSTLTLYGAWWLVGGMLVAASVLIRRPAESSIDSPMAALPGRLYMLVPFISLVVHLCGANRVYALVFHPANVAPVLLGAAVVLSRWRAPHNRQFLATMQMSLAALAVLISVSFPMELMVHAGSHVISPLRLSLLGAFGVLIMTFIQTGQLIVAQIALTVALAAALGNTPIAMQLHFVAMMKALYASGRRLVPETQMQWGIIAVVSSFVMLGVGAVVSLRKHPVRSAEKVPSA
jgi:hypothetical protein